MFEGANVLYVISFTIYYTFDVIEIYFNQRKRVYLCDVNSPRYQGAPKGVLLSNVEFTLKYTINEMFKHRI